MLERLFRRDRVNALLAWLLVGAFGQAHITDVATTLREQIFPDV